MTWTENRNLKHLVKELENAACSCDAMIGFSCGNHKIANQLRDEIAKEVEAKTLNVKAEDLETCSKCGKIEEGDIFAGIIDDKYVCADCCEPLKAKWYEEQRTNGDKNV